MSNTALPRLAASILAAIACALGASAAAAQRDGLSRGTAILVYHRFGAVATDSMTVTTRVFEQHLLAIRERGYTVVRARQFVDSLRAGFPELARSVVITVDDGHRSVYTDMWPLVRRHQIPVTLFVYPSAISNAAYAMTWVELEELARSGLVDVHSHTYWHPDLLREKRRLAAADYARFADFQLVRSRQVLEKRIGAPVNLLAWPFGNYDAELMSRAAGLGYDAAFTLERRAARSSDPLMALPRYLVTDADRGPRFEHLLAP